MNSITSYGKTDLQSGTLMSFSPATINAERQRKKLWKAEGVSYMLALLIHLSVWQLYQALPVPQPPKEPPLIEAALIMAPRTPIAAAPTPLPQVQQPPKPKPIPKPLPKPEKPVVKKPDRPKPMPKPQPQVEAAPAPTPVEEAAPAPVIAPKGSPKAEVEPGEDTRYHTGGISGFSRRYNRLAQERGWEGTVTLKVHILADGEIGEVIVISSSGHDVLDEQAVELIKEAHATPARRGDKPVDSWVVVPYQFKLKKS